MEPAHRWIVESHWLPHFYSLDHPCHLKLNLNYTCGNVHSSSFQTLTHSTSRMCPTLDSPLSLQWIATTCYLFFLLGSVRVEPPHRFPLTDCTSLLTPVVPCHVPWLLLLALFPPGHNAFESWHGIMKRAVESHGPELKSQHRFLLTECPEESKYTSRRFSILS